MRLDWILAKNLVQSSPVQNLKKSFSPVIPVSHPVQSAHPTFKKLRHNYRAPPGEGRP